MAIVKYYGNLKQIMKKEQEEIQTESMVKLLQYYKKNVPKEVYSEIKSSHLVVNGQRISYSWLNQCPLNKNDRVDIYPVCGGG